MESGEVRLPAILIPECSPGHQESSIRKAWLICCCCCVCVYSEGKNWVNQLIDYLFIVHRYSTYYNCRPPCNSSVQFLLSYTLSVRRSWRSWNNRSPCQEWISGCWMDPPQSWVVWRKRASSPVVDVVLSCRNSCFFLVFKFDPNTRKIKQSTLQKVPIVTREHTGNQVIGVCVYVLTQDGQIWPEIRHTQQQQQHPELRCQAKMGHTTLVDGLVAKTKPAPTSQGQ